MTGWTYEIVRDHEHFGNVCGGFGGDTSCQHIDWDTGQRCGRPPMAHRYQPPSHRRDGPTDESHDSTRHGEGRHRAHGRHRAEGYE